MMTGSRFNEFIDAEEGVNCRLESADSALRLWKEKELLKWRFLEFDCYLPSVELKCTYLDSMGAEA